MALSSLDRIRLDKAAVDEGFGLRRPSEEAGGDAGSWLVYGSLAAPVALRLTRAAEGYVVTVDHPGVAADLAERWPSRPGTAPAGYVAFVVTDTAPLHDLIREIWRLARTLPIAPLRAFEDRTAALPRCTEAERLTVRRIGQDLFRAALMDYWSGACAVTGLSDAGLIAFTDDGTLLASPAFAPADRTILGIREGMRLRRLSPAHRPRPAWHRAEVFCGAR